MGEGRGTKLAAAGKRPTIFTGGRHEAHALACSRNPVLAVLAVSAARSRPDRPGRRQAATATIHQGVNTTTRGSSCTANELITSAARPFTSARHASMLGTGGNTTPHGCDSPTAGRHGGRSPSTARAPPDEVLKLVWHEQARGETDANTCHQRHGADRFGRRRGEGQPSTRSGAARPASRRTRRRPRRSCNTATAPAAGIAAVAEEVLAGRDAGGASTRC